VRGAQRGGDLTGTGGVRGSERGGLQHGYAPGGCTRPDARSHQAPVRKLTPCRLWEARKERRMYTAAASVVDNSFFAFAK
jgi:hypothetical protein